ncbi:MAG: hypothetical protein ABIP75_19330 [Pyrinomonadaceae bacterium]
MDTGKAALGGLDGNLAAALGYPIGIIALLSVFMEKENKFVKFHALQSLFMLVGWVVFIIALVIVSMIIGMIAGGAAGSGGAAGAAGSIVGIILSLVWLLTFLLLPLVYVAIIIFAAVKAYGGNMFKLPIIGNIAEGMANK